VLTGRNDRLFSFLFLLGLSVTPLEKADALCASGESYPEHLCSGLQKSVSNPRWLFAAGAIAALSNFDQEVKDQCSGRLLPSSLADYGDWYGLGLNYLTGSCIIIGDGWVNNRISRKETLEKLQYLTEAYVLTNGFTQFIKYVTHRRRPDGSNRFSFPSGHSSGSFAVAGSLGQFYGPTASVLTYALAILSGISRIDDDKHWLSDVLSGGLLGQLVGDGFGRLYHERTRPKAGKGNREVLIFFSMSF